MPTTLHNGHPAPQPTRGASCTSTTVGGIGNQRLADRLGTGVGTGSNVTTGSASAQLADLRARVAAIVGWGMGTGLNDSATGAYVSMRVSISLDGGTTWSNGEPSRDQVGNTNNLGQSRRRWSMSPHHLFSGTPTGAVHVRAEHASSLVSTDGLNPAFYFGRVTAMMVPIG
ncbi:hypothetical protein ABZ863_29485 [Saccharomonospora sp. NPDC046836]|uniref:hypothetical protein n=1 Tax=Saccharomonospora sp. NPDC046836 TaxID=3156921 RepID=UPI0033F1359B